MFVSVDSDAALEYAQGKKNELDSEVEVFLIEHSWIFTAHTSRRDGNITLNTHNFNRL